MARVEERQAEPTTLFRKLSRLAIRQDRPFGSGDSMILLDLLRLPTRLAVRKRLQTQTLNRKEGPKCIR